MTIFEFTNMFWTNIKCKDFLPKNKFIFCLKHSNSKMYIRRNDVVCCSIRKKIYQNQITNFDKFIGITEIDEAYFSYQTVNLIRISPKEIADQKENLKYLVL